MYKTKNVTLTRCIKQRIDARYKTKNVTLTARCIKQRMSHWLLDVLNKECHTDS